MLENIPRILFIAMLVVLVYWLILGLHLWVESKLMEAKLRKTLSSGEVTVEGYVKSLHDKTKEIRKELTHYGCTEYFLYGPDSDRYIRILENDIIQALRQGVEYKRKYESLLKNKELELRKFCIEQHPDKRSRLSDRIGYAEILYQYITTGKQPENKEDRE